MALSLTVRGGWGLLVEVLLHLRQSFIDFFELGIFLAFVAALLDCGYHVAQFVKGFKSVDLGFGFRIDGFVEISVEFIADGMC